jgi:hypothetical protein
MQAGEIVLMLDAATIPARARIEKLPRFVAGVDPGKTTGVGVYDRTEGRIVFIHTTDFFGVADFLMRWVRISDLKVYVEIPRVFMYDRNGAQQGSVRDKMLINIGGVRREAELLAGLLRGQGFTVEEVPPITEKKWTQQKFQQITKCKRQTNEHERDACRIAFVYANKRRILGG